MEEGPDKILVVVELVGLVLGLRLLALELVVGELVDLVLAWFY